MIKETKLISFWVGDQLSSLISALILVRSVPDYSTLICLDLQKWLRDAWLDEDGHGLPSWHGGIDNRGESSEYSCWAIGSSYRREGGRWEWRGRLVRTAAQPVIGVGCDDCCLVLPTLPCHLFPSWSHLSRSPQSRLSYPPYKSVPNWATEWGESTKSFFQSQLRAQWLKVWPRFNPIT
jgi:hypothetical protein